MASIDRDGSEHRLTLSSASALQGGPLVAHSGSMDAAQAQALKELLAAQEVAALGTLHKGEPFVSMVPYALLPAPASFVIHVSRLATHTRDMEEHAGVSLLALAPRASAASAQALARATVQGEARRCTPADPEYANARAAYLGRFPDAEPLFGFADFSLFLVAPRSARFVGGFAQAGSLAGPDLVRLLQS
jgi:putative heme iron utilization protein